MVFMVKYIYSILVKEIVSDVCINNVHINDKPYYIKLPDIQMLVGCYQ